MKKFQVRLNKEDIDESDVSGIKDINPDLIFVFGSPGHFAKGKVGGQLKKYIPNAEIIGCSTAGEISEKGVTDDTIVITGMSFNECDFKSSSEVIKNMDDSYAAGQRLGKKLAGDNLKSIFLLSTGVDVNGTALIEGMKKELGTEVMISGGLAGDKAAFVKTYTLLNENIGDRTVVAFGNYSDNVLVGSASQGGWEAFGPIRKISKCEGNVLYELDGESALDLYKKYLGDDAEKLPGSGLLYPFAILNEDEDTTGLIRTILAIDEEKGSLTLAGEVEEGGLLRLMHASNDGLIDGAEKAARVALERGEGGDGVGILVSCVGRKLVMGDDTEDEVDAVHSIFGNDTILTGFYSYGEICPFTGVYDTKLHNQTMTVTFLSEKKKAA